MDISKFEINKTLPNIVFYKVKELGNKSEITYIDKKGNIKKLIKPLDIKFSSQEELLEYAYGKGELIKIINPKDVAINYNFVMKLTDKRFEKKFIGYYKELENLYGVYNVGDRVRIIEIEVGGYYEGKLVSKSARAILEWLNSVGLAVKNRMN